MKITHDKLNYQLYSHMFIVIEIFTCTHKISATFIHSIVYFRQSKMSKPAKQTYGCKMYRNSTLMCDLQYITHINVSYCLSNPWIQYNIQQTIIYVHMYTSKSVQS